MTAFNPIHLEDLFRSTVAPIKLALKTSYIHINHYLKVKATKREVPSSVRLARSFSPLSK